MTDQKPPAPGSKPPAAPLAAPSATPVKPQAAPPAPKPVSTPVTAGKPQAVSAPRPPVKAPQTPPPLPKPNFTAPPASGAQKPAPVPAAKPPLATAPSSTVPRPVAAAPVSAPASSTPRPSAPAVRPPAPAGLPKPPSATVPSLTPRMPAAPGAAPSLAPRPPGAPMPAAVPGKAPATGELRPPSSSILQAKVSGASAAGGLAKSPVGAADASGELPAPPKPAEFKRSPLRFLPIIVAILLVLGIGYFVYNRFFARSSSTANNTNTTRNNTGTNTNTNTGNNQARGQIVLTYWGLWEPSRVLQDTLAEFEKQNPGIKVNYQQQNYRDYRERLQTSIAGGKGPDVFRFHASWVPMMRAELNDVPTSVYSATEYQSTFYPVAEQQLKLNNKYVGVPLMYEGLALFYNKEALNTANVQPPKTWTELKEVANRLTIRSGTTIQRAGLAIGNASNVDHFSDILGLLMLQNSTDMTKPLEAKSSEAVRFYTEFYTKDKVWDATLPSSTVAFARGDVAMIFAPSWRVHDIVALNPNLSFGVAPVPQLTNNKVTWASYWAEGVSAQSRNKESAWKLIKYLSSKEALQKLHSDASKERSFGEIYSRVDMASMLSDSQYEAPYLVDAPFAKGGYLSSFTHDNGLNDQIIKYYEDAITAITSGSKQQDSALQTADQGIKQILRQYNLNQ
jgi:multiple sugar transport system substrate-binding protein